MNLVPNLVHVVQMVFVNVTKLVNVLVNLTLLDVDVINVKKELMLSHKIIHWDVLAVSVLKKLEDVNNHPCCGLKKATINVKPIL